MAKTIRASFALTGADSLASKDGSILQEGDITIVFNSTGTKIYKLTVDNAAVIDNTTVIAPSINPETKKWLLVSDIEPIVNTDYTEDSSPVPTLKVPQLPQGILQKAISNPNPYGTTTNDKFGFGLSICDSYFIAGAAYEDETGTYASDSGKAYIFDTNTGDLLHILNNPNAYSTSGLDYFGYNSDICESYCVVSAIGEDDSEGSYSGKAYIFNPATGELLHTLDNPNAYGTSSSDKFGQTVSITESYCVVSAPEEDEDVLSGSGKVYIFNPATGELLHTLSNPNPSTDTNFPDKFGYSVAITESYCIVGTYYNEHAYIFNPATGELLYTLNNPSVGQTRFGTAVNITESYSIVGAYMEINTSDSKWGSGKVYIYNNATGELIRTIENPNAYGTSENDYFGIALDINESYCIVGVFNEDYSGGTSSGVAYIFNNVTGELLYTIEDPSAYGTPTSDRFGQAVAIGNTMFAVAAFGEGPGTESGKVYLFK